MRALSVRNPWAWMIFECGKDVENRSFPTRHRGLLLIHASAASKMVDYDAAAPLSPYSPPFPPHLPHGFLLGTVRVVGCVQDADTYSKWAERGSWHWLLADPVAFDEPIPCKGTLGLWEAPEGILPLRSPS